MLNTNINAPKFYDINRVPGNGKLVLPLSMSRLHTGQSAKAVFEFINFFLAKCETLSIDVILVYTNGLYCNSNEIAHTVRRRTLAQMMEHKRRISTFFGKQKFIPPSALHFELMDNLILKDSTFIEKFVRLKELYNEHGLFHKLVNSISIETDAVSNAGVDFILEETIVSYLIREKLVSLPQNLSDSGAWQLICYPGKPNFAEVYLFQHDIFKQYKKKNMLRNSFCNYVYNSFEYVILNYAEFEFDEKELLIYE